MLKSNSRDVLLCFVEAKINYRDYYEVYIIIFSTISMFHAINVRTLSTFEVIVFLIQLDYRLTVQLFEYYYYI